jgi:hypothetical protein
MYEQVWIIHDGLCSMDLYGTHKTLKIIVRQVDTFVFKHLCWGVH